MSAPSNGTWKMDLHVHTQYSCDGFTTPEQLLRSCLRRGLAGVAVTDHDTIEGALVFRRELPIEVIIGEEVSTTSGHVIGLFLTERVPPGLSATETIRLIRQQGGLVCVPHPFDRVRSSHIPVEELHEIAGQLDMVEIFNSYNLFEGADRLAAEFAGFAGKPGTAGSDAHVAGEVGRSYVEMAPFAGPRQFLENLGRAHLVCRKTSLAVRAVTKARKKIRNIGDRRRMSWEGYSSLRG